METKRSRNGAWKIAVMIANVGLGAAGIAWAVGQFLRDRTWLTGLCFYIPSPLFGSLLLLAGGWSFSPLCSSSSSAVNILS